jgi:predicted secreted protein
MKKFIPIICVISLLSTPFAYAESGEDKVKEVVGTFVSLSASDQKKVEQDLLVASLRIELDNKDARKVQDEINKAMQKAMDIAKAEPSIKVSTGNYYVYSYDPNPSPTPLSREDQQKRMVWKGSQTIDLQSKDSQKILEIVGKIQDAGFAMNGLNYMLSPELAEAQKDELLVGALKKIKTKAELISKTLGKSGYDIVEVNIDGSYMPQPQPVMMMARSAKMEMASDSMSSPVAAPSETDVSLSVSARILLKP